MNDKAALMSIYLPIKLSIQALTQPMKKRVLLETDMIQWFERKLYTYISAVFCNNSIHSGNKTRFSPIIYSESKPIDIQVTRTLKLCKKEKSTRNETGGNTVNILKILYKTVRKNDDEILKSNK